MYEFHRDNEGISWRIIGHTARICIELGLHRRETYEAMQDESERSETALLFWAIYVLDRRWSFGTGMPFALQDSDIDPQVPKPGDRSPYLSAMLDYCAIAARVWRSVVSSASSDNATIKTEEMDYLDGQIIQWHNSIPSNLRYEHPSQRTSTPSHSATTRAGRRLPMVLYLRANQMRILIYRSILHSATSIMQHHSQAQIAIVSQEEPWASHGVLLTGTGRRQRYNSRINAHQSNDRPISHATDALQLVPHLSTGGALSSCFACSSSVCC